MGPYLQNARHDLQRTARCAVLVLAGAALLLTAMLTRPQGLSVDFPSFYSAAGTLAAGDNPYDIRALRDYAAGRGIDTEVYPYLYPPFLASVLRPWVSLAPGLADRVWGALMIVLFALSALVVMMAPGRGRPSPPRDAALALGLLLLLPLGQNFAMGQVNALVMLCVTVAVVGVERGGTQWERMAGAALAIAALIKVTPALLLVLLVARKKYDAVWSFLAVAGAGVALSAAISGVQVWGQFVAFLPATAYGRNIDGLFHPIFVTNLSISGCVLRLFEGAGTAARATAMAASLALLAALGLGIVRRREAAGVTLALLIVMVVISPYTWIHHLVFIYPGAFFFFRDMLDRTGRDPGRIILAGALFVGLTVDFPRFYGAMGIPEPLWSSLTSLNLYFLLGMFALSLHSVLAARRRASHPAAAGPRLGPAVAAGA